jgi:archaemetzincin
MPEERQAKHLFPDLEARLASLAEPLGQPEEGDWLAEYPEPGQSFDEYLAADPVRRDDTLSTLYLCLVGDLDAPKQQVIDRTQEYLRLFFDVPVLVRRRVGLADIPARARRTHPGWGSEQVLSKYVLREILEPDLPGNALAYLALTASDLWPGKGWNFVFGQANPRRRVGVWSIHRNGEPASPTCLRRTLMTASHETGHVLTMKHCVAPRCLMNGSNHQEERDGRPLHPCPVCLRKLCWSLRVEPAPWLRRLAGFCGEHGLGDDARWFARAAQSAAE